MGLLVVDFQRLRAILVLGRKGLFVVFAAGHGWLVAVAGSDKAVGARRGRVGWAREGVVGCGEAETRD